ncbi:MULTISPECIES: DUF4141 domain-containing protein [Myroides]|uniref:DUF4141 domain-containing protein n=1 Tax=Myroides albus TaxID=2562892 RepID=A0A6I3LIA8_9FLAO|nr:MULTISPECIES: DUF4141 domain-containing protein [Myroides]MTG99339.1 DUF4141 domain-containing protein [Myroides albus]MVX35497.1 DUF4141 domain-containing protein [Myroides sp. LoEW2-1]UVD79089.1 DUF4141 domain-containing protein [Myroides albus]
MKKIYQRILTAFLFLFSSVCFGQWTVYDPGNFAQSIINSTNEIVQTSATVENVIRNFKEVEKIYNQTKDYYNKLESVNHLVKDARKVQQTVLLVSDVSKLYVQGFSKMLNDSNFSDQELEAIANGYAKLLSESTVLLNELKQIVTKTSLSLNDKERMDIIDTIYSRVKYYYNLVDYYTKKNISVSILRSKKKSNTQSILDLYGESNSKYW